MDETPNSRRSIAVFLVLVAALAIVSAGWRIFGSRGVVGKRTTVVLKIAPNSLPKDELAASEIKAKVETALQRRAEQLLKPVWGNAKVEQSGDTFTVAFPGNMTDKQAVIKTLTTTTNLEFYWLRDVEGKNNPTAKYRMIHDVQDGEEIISFQDKSTNKMIRGDTPEGQAQILKQIVNAYDPAKNPNGCKPELTGDDLDPVSKAETDPIQGPVISIKFNQAGSEKFYQFTRKHFDDYLAIFLDGRLLTAPVIKSPITDGRAQIEGVRSLERAKMLAQALNAGTLPVPLTVLSVNGK